jgi:hypothetical protein
VLLTLTPSLWNGSRCTTYLFRALGEAIQGGPRSSACLSRPVGLQTSKVIAGLRVTTDAALPALATRGRIVVISVVGTRVVPLDLIEFYRNESRR